MEESYLTDPADPEHRTSMASGYWSVQPVEEELLAGPASR